MLKGEPSWNIFLVESWSTYEMLLPEKPTIEGSNSLLGSTTSKQGNVTFTGCCV